MRRENCLPYAGATLISRRHDARGAQPRGNEGGSAVQGSEDKARGRSIALPLSAVDTLRLHRRQQLELRLALGIGRPEMTHWFSVIRRRRCHRTT